MSSSEDSPLDAEAEITGRARGSGRVRRLVGSSRALAAIVYRDPQHVPERLTLIATHRLSQPSLDWAQAALATRPELDPDVIAEELRVRSATAARIDGAVAGTPFLVALIPGYLAYLAQEAIMVLRTAALYGRDPRELSAAAEMLALRGVHRSPEAAREALDAVLAKPLPEKPARRRSLRNWAQSVRMVLVFGGFLSPPAERSQTGWRAQLMVAIGLLFGVFTFAITSVFPVTFIIAMAWGCESHTRDLGRRAQAFYRGEAQTTTQAIAAARSHRETGHDKRRSVRTIALVISLAVPIGFVAYADHERNRIGITALGAAAALIALSLVVATTVVAVRR